jgi:hypothetical protein
MVIATELSAEIEAAARNPATPAAQLWELAQRPELAPLVAANPAAPAELLRELGLRMLDALPLPAAQAVALMTHGTPSIATEHLRQLGLRADDPVLAAVAANPNTPVDTLVRLAGIVPAQFCANPALFLLLLENPNLPGEIPAATMRGLLRYAGVPRMFLEWLVAYGLPDIAAAARLHVAYAGEADDWAELATTVIWQLQIPDGDELLLELLALGAVPPWLIPLIAANAARDIRSALVRSPLATRTALKWLRRAGASGDLASYAPPDPALDRAVLEQLATGGVYARRVVARNPYAPPALLTRLAADPDRSVRQGVARNPCTPLPVLLRLAADPSPEVRQGVARNAATSGDILAQLAADPARDVRWTVARNPRISPALLTRLAADPDRAVRQGVARNPESSPELLTVLASDSHVRVRQAARRRLGLPAEADSHAHMTRQMPRAPELSLLPAQQANELHPNVRAAFAAQPNIDAQLLARLAEDEHPQVRAAAARNPALPLALLEWLADDDVIFVHRGVAENPHTPEPILARFAADPTWSNMRVRLAVVRHPHVSASILERLAGDHAVEVRRAVLAHPLTPAAARTVMLERSLDMCARSSESFYHVLALAHPLAPTAYVQSRASSPEWLERYAIARNPRAPHSALVQLTEDGNRIVRAAARAALAAAPPDA